MFEAGRRSFAAFSSYKTLPVSSETTLIPIIAGASSGLRRMSVIRLCNSATVLVGFEVLVADPTGVGDTAGGTVGDCAGDATGLGSGVAEEVGVVDLRSRCAVAVKSATGIVTSRTSNASNDLLFIRSFRPQMNADDTD